MVTRTCGHCGERSHLTARWQQWFERPDGHRVQSVVLSCDACFGATVATNVDPSHVYTSEETAAHWAEVDGSVWAPAAVVGKTFPDAPAQISATADEAYRCASVDSRRGAILLARTAIEATAKDQGVHSGNLKSKIDELAAKELIRPGIARAAQQVRLAGNDMAHGDLGNDPDKEDVEQMLRLLDLVLREVYETPALVDFVVSKRENAGFGREDTPGSEYGSVHVQ